MERESIMRRDLMRILVCPECKQPLELTVVSEKDGEVIEGSLRCSGCGEVYPIENTIPNMLPPALRT